MPSASRRCHELASNLDSRLDPALGIESDERADGDDFDDGDDLDDVDRADARRLKARVELDQSRPAWRARSRSRSRRHTGDALGQHDVAGARARTIACL
jgi:hypothetical protein